MKNLILTITLLISFSSFGQNNYADGYKQGYKKVNGYTPSDNKVSYTLQIPEQLREWISNIDNKNYENGYFLGYVQALPYKKKNLMSPADVRNYYKTQALILKKSSKSRTSIFKIKKKIGKGKISQKLAKSLLDEISNYKFLENQHAKYYKQ
jgi:hypothetical protein|tara:strand:- start:44 stop:499 length:456 start_codon:yes stop_codon:yes gene_type:complete